jgi:hypothetical protein
VLCLINNELYFYLSSVITFDLPLIPCALSIEKYGNMTLVLQWLKLAPSKGPNSVGASLPSPEDGNRFSFQNIIFSSYFRTQDHGQSLESQ